MFEWDADNEPKIAAHDLTTDEVESAVLEPYSLDGDPQLVAGETRYVLFGTTSTARIVRVIYTLRDERLRVVTAHDANRGQQRRYMQHRLKLLAEE